MRKDGYFDACEQMKEKLFFQEEGLLQKQMPMHENYDHGNKKSLNAAHFS
ncbi:MAG: hypothetical protein KQH67_10475 [Bacteroidetes bacterium]|nr:hypothetical protein [Bacteroidota bacterium]